MGIFIPGSKEKRAREWREHYAALRADDNVMMVRRRAIWAGRDPDLAEKQYREAIRRHNQKKNG